MSSEEDINPDGSPDSPAGNPKDNGLFDPKPQPKVIRVLTVLAYILSVSMAAILLSIYYIFMWEGHPHIGARRSEDIEVFNHSGAELARMKMTKEHWTENAIDYYWRDYTGELPPDAVQGGTHQGKPIYVGQAYFRKYEFLPVTIYDPSTGKKPKTGAYDEILEATTNVQILCSPVKENFRWIPTESKKLHLMSDKHYVIGGNEVGQELLIGRVYRNNDAVLGKIFQDSQSNRGLWVPGKEHNENYLSYEVLTFICGSVVDEK